MKIFLSFLLLLGFTANAQLIIPTLVLSSGTVGGDGLILSVDFDFEVDGGELSLTNTVGTGAILRESAANGSYTNLTDIPSEFTPEFHTHDATNIVSGELDPARYGTNTIPINRLTSEPGILGRASGLGSGEVGILTIGATEFIQGNLNVDQIELYLVTNNIPLLDRPTNIFSGHLSVSSFETPEMTVGDLNVPGTLNASAVTLDGTNILDLVSGGGGGPGKETITLTAMNSEAPTDDYGTLVNRGATPNLLLSYVHTVDQCNYWNIWIPPYWDLSNGLDVTVTTYTTSATSGTNVYEVAFDYLVGQDIDTDSFDTGALFLAPAAGTSGIATIVSVTMTNLDSAAAGGHVKIAGCRLPGHASDNIDEPIQLQSIAITPAD